MGTRVDARRSVPIPSGERKFLFLALDNQQVRAVSVTPGQAFTVGRNEVVMTVPGMGSAWDVDWRSGRLIVSEPVVTAQAQIVVMQHWLEDFRRRLASRAAP